ncbi:MAG: DUF4931 domain-containing protein [Nanoarchaeota archaeon]
MELRKDYLLDRWVIVSEVRAKRPRDFKKKAVKANEENICFFCPGHEHLTPPEIMRVGGRKWRFRVFPNKFPAVSEEGWPHIKTDNTYFTFGAAYGRHEVIVETSDHDQQLWDLTGDDISELFRIYDLRIQALSRLQHTEYVALFKNHGKEGGTSLIHSHTQLLSINMVPIVVQHKLEATLRHGHCPYCEIIHVEKNSYRRCFENDDFVAFTPYASRFNFEIWVFPKKHLSALNQLMPAQRSSLGDIMQKILAKLKSINASYNYFLHYAPQGKDLHFHIEVTPRLATWAGFEYCTGITINSVSPEEAAKFYRGE